MMKIEFSLPSHAYKLSQQTDIKIADSFRINYDRD